jgi:monoamine oxidase
MSTSWCTDPWSLGSYSALPVGCPPSTREDLGWVLLGDRIALAGEYTDSAHPATTNGAYASGRRAAGRLLNHVAPRTAIVIGAGMAGAAAAQRLSSAGVQVRVLEARNRIGGRIHSRRVWGSHVELGASWVHGVRGNPVASLARNDGLTLTTTDYDDAVVRDSVTGRPSAEADRRWGQLDGLLGRMEDQWSPMSLSSATWLADRGWVNDRIGRWATQVELVQEYGLDSTRLAARATQEGASLHGDDAMVGGGYATIPATLLNGIDVALSTPVVQVQRVGRAVEVRTEGGQRLTADAVVVAVPLALVRAETPVIDPMPTWVRRSLSRVATGTLEKVILRFQEPWWGDQRILAVVGGGVPGAPEGSAASLRWTEFYSLTDVVGVPTLMALSGGSAARAKPTSPQACAAEALAMLRYAFGDV